MPKTTWQFPDRDEWEADWHSNDGRESISSECNGGDSEGSTGTALTKPKMGFYYHGLHIL